MKMLRTKSEDPCWSCGRITNVYDVLMGRICPECATKISVEFGNYFGNKVEKEKTEPMISHSSRDIE